MCSIGLGNLQANLLVHIANRPPLEEFLNIERVRPLTAGEIHFIAESTGNHWCKIFNVFAKLAFELNQQNETTWQALRDKQLLSNTSDQLLLFSPPNLSQQQKVKIICGKTYFNQLKLDMEVDWIDDYFAVNVAHKLIVSPYFDYRQLSNIRITQLSALINQMQLA